MSHFNSRGHRKGLAIYFPLGFSPSMDANHDRFQLSSISSDKMIITNVYRSKDAGAEFLDTLSNFIQDRSKIHVFMGDWNFGQRNDFSHPVKLFLEENNFKTGINPPQPSHIKGRCLDQIYIRFPDHPLHYDSSLKVCVYSDHEPISLKFEMGT